MERKGGKREINEEREREREVKRDRGTGKLVYYLSGKPGKDGAPQLITDIVVRACGDGGGGTEGWGYMDRAWEREQGG